MVDLYNLYSKKYYSRYKELVKNVKSVYIRCNHCNTVNDITESIKNSIDNLNTYGGNIIKCDNCNNKIYIFFISFNMENIDFNSGFSINDLQLQDFFENKIEYKY